MPFIWQELAAIFAGGFAGAVARAELVEALPHSADAWPWATFIANLAGALALGWFATRMGERLRPSARRRRLLETGLCGALTTFSAMQLELVRMLDAGAAALALGYVTASVLAGYAAVVLGAELHRRLGTARAA